jgi:Notch-like protein
MCSTDGLVCLNSGTCPLTTTDQTSPTCICPSGFAGDNCSAISCGSEGNACFNGGHCNETTGICICPPPLTSDDCRGSKHNLSKTSNIGLYFIDICGAGTANSIVCQNDGVCIINSEGEWACNCTRGWTGPYCMLHMCGDDPSSSLTCAHEGTCVHLVTTGASTCSCQPQWAGIDCSGMRCSEPEITCYNQVDFDPKICTPNGCDCLNDGYGADCRGVRCGLEPGRCYNGAVCIDNSRSICSSCAPGVSGHDCSMSNRFLFSFSFFVLDFLILVMCPGVKSGYCFNGGVCISGTTCLCGLRSEWSGVDCSESKS